MTREECLSTIEKRVQSFREKDIPYVYGQFKKDKNVICVKIMERVIETKVSIREAVKEIENEFNINFID